jgi:pyruvate/2-oxoacid:ferredoxin oxidoreductase beta subunit
MSSVEVQAVAGDACLGSIGGNALASAIAHMVRRGSP